VTLSWHGPQGILPEPDVSYVVPQKKGRYHKKQVSAGVIFKEVIQFSPEKSFCLALMIIAQSVRK